MHNLIIAGVAEERYLESCGGSKEGAKGTLGINWNPLPEGVSMGGRVQAADLH